MMRRLFIESSFFSKKLKQLINNNKITEKDYKQFQEQLLHNPKSGAVIPGLSGLRKIRLGYQGKGTRGGLRVDYLDIPEAECLHLLVLYTKNEKEDLTPDEKKEIRDLVKKLKKEAVESVHSTKRKP
jgi:hypothetical protein